MATSDSQKKATKKWQQEKTDEMRFRVPKGEKDIIATHASACGESVTAFLQRAVKECIERDNAE